MNDKKRRTDQSQSISDMIRIEGINCKGYGLVPKCVMMDRDLSATSRGIYAYFCSFAGSGYSQFPNVSLIWKHLRISKSTYYKHYNPLIEQGYIEATQTLVEGRLTRNVYTLIDKPKKYLQEPSDPALTDIYESVREKGIHSLGYGFMPKATAMDTRLEITSKTIYAFFSVYAGSSGVAFPSRQVTVYYLGLSSPTYSKHFGTLVTYNYVTPSQRRQNGQFGINDYFLNANPDESTVPPKRLSVRIAPKKRITKKESAEPEQSLDANENQPSIQEEPHAIAVSYRYQKNGKQYSGK